MLACEGDYLQDFVGWMHKGKHVLSIAHINIRSLRNKVDEIRILLNVCKFDVLTISETYLDKKISNSQLEVENYKGRS